MDIIVAITGASGVIYSKRLLEEIKKRKVVIHLIISDTARQVIDHELVKKVNIMKLAEKVYHPNDLRAPITSGSFKVDGMVIIPTSMKTMAAIASGYCENLITRAADVQLKEGRKIILVPRETPLNAIHLENMTKLSRLGVTILPAMPAFYHKPEKIDDLVDFIVGKILDQLNLNHELYQRWGSCNPKLS